MRMKRVLEKHEISTTLKKKALGGIISKSAPAQIRDFVLEDVNRIGQTVEFKFLVNGWIDGYIKGRFCHSYCSRYFLTMYKAKTFRPKVIVKSVKPRANATSVSGLSNSKSPVS